ALERGRAAPAAREDVAKVLVARDEKHEVIQLLPRPDRGDGRRLTGWRGEGRRSRQTGDDGEEDRRERRDEGGQSKALGGSHGRVPECRQRSDSKSVSPPGSSGSRGLRGGRSERVPRSRRTSKTTITPRKMPNPPRRTS